MKLYEHFGDSGYHTCVSTTFGIDFDAYENIALPRLRGASCSNNILLVDERMLTYALDGASTLPQHAGRHYSVAGIPPKAVFHPKITLQLGRRAARAIIASANMTASGLAGNLELAGMISCAQEANGEARLIAAVWFYIEDLLRAEGQGLHHQLEWLRPRTPWLFDTAPATGAVELVDGSAAALLTANGNGSAAGIGTRFAGLVDGEKVERLVVLSPYWDEDLAALAALAARLAPEKVTILIDRGTALFPAHAASVIENAEILDLNEFGKARFIHAKAIVAETEHADHVLYGSANCTAAALGTGNSAGLNHEACLYRRLPPRSILGALGLAKVIDEGIAIRPAELEAYRREEDLPLAEARDRSPGRFEAAFDTLFWRPPAKHVDQAEIELLDVNGRPLAVTLTPQTNSGDALRKFRLSGAKERPSFARLRFANGQTSAPAIVAIVEALRETVREARGRKAEAAALQLSDETEEGLWLWEVLNELETAERAQNEQGPGSKRPGKTATGSEAVKNHGQIAYEQFIAGRQLRSDTHGAERNSLAGTELSLVRNFLNRILAIGDDITGPASNEDPVARGLDLGDEIQDAATALERGEELTAAPGTEDPDLPNEEDRRRAARARASREQIAQAVVAFNSRIKEKAEAGKLGTFDVLRLRAILMIVAAAGRPFEGVGQPTTLQVLPLSNDADSWPRLMGQLLFAFFGGNRPAVWKLEIEAIHDQLPDDIVECWATALWAIQACICAADRNKAMQPHTHKALTRLALHLYVRTGLQPQEVGGEAVSRMFTKLNERFCARLGLSPDAMTGPKPPLADSGEVRLGS